jgi:hypothetical protein
MPLCQPTASRSYPLCVSNTARARRPPLLLARGSVGDQSAHARARVPYRNPNELLRAIAQPSRSLGALTGCCCALLRPGAPPRARSRTSKPLAATRAYSASSCIPSFRAPGLHARPSSDGPSSMVAYAEQSPRTQRSSSRFLDCGGARYERLLLQTKGRMLTSRREPARGSPRRTQAARTKLEAGLKRKLERSYADHRRRAGQ